MPVGTFFTRIGYKMNAFFQKTGLILPLILIFTGLPDTFAQAPKNKDDAPIVNVGGALRFNYNLSSWKTGQKKRGGDFGFDVFRINAEATWRRLSLNAEYRLYSSGFGGGILKHGWITYDINPVSEVQVGLSQVPFGIRPYSSNSWFFTFPYYIGFEDDYDMGVKYVYRKENLEFDLAYYHSAEDLVFSDRSPSANRYSYDITGPNKENQTFNGQFVIPFGEQQYHRIGASGMWGRLYNIESEEQGDRHALALHYQYKPAKYLNLKIQALTYDFRPVYPEGDELPFLIMGAYGANYQVALGGEVYSLAISYELPVNFGPITQLTFYEDYAFFDKRNPDFEDTHMNVVGMMVTAGQVYTYFDYAAGYNHPWLGPVWTTALSTGNQEDDTQWSARFNVNIGYYF